MKINYDEVTLPVSRVTEVTISAYAGDSVLVKTSSGEIQVKEVDGVWTVFCGPQINVEAST